MKKSKKSRNNARTTKNSVIDVTTQEPERVRALRRTSRLDTGEMYIFMQRVEVWAAGIRCFVTIPNNSEYMKIKREQDE